MSQLNQIKKHQILFHDGELAEFVSFYTGANKAGGILIFKIKDKYYLEQNPTSGSIFGSLARRGNRLYWELSEYPNRSKGLKYTGNIVFMFRLLETQVVKSYINSLLKKEREALKSIDKKPVYVSV